MYNDNDNLGKQFLGKPTKCPSNNSSRTHAPLCSTALAASFLILLKSSRQLNLNDLILSGQVFTCEDHVVSNVNFQGLLSNEIYRKR